MLPSSCPCSVCGSQTHGPRKCPELYSDTGDNDHPTPSGPRGQDEDD